MKKKRQKDRSLPLKRGIEEKVYRRKDSSLWQARFVTPDGKLKRRSTGTRNRQAARECLLLLKREAQRKAQQSLHATARRPPPHPTFFNPNLHHQTHYE